MYSNPHAVPESTPVLLVPGHLARRLHLVDLLGRHLELKRLPERQLSRKLHICDGPIHHRIHRQSKVPLDVVGSDRGLVHGGRRMSAGNQAYRAKPEVCVQRFGDPRSQPLLILIMNILVERELIYGALADWGEFRPIG